MRKGVIILLVGLALVIFISPGLIGRLAEQSVDEGIRSGTITNDEVIVTAMTFDRGWFSTEGEHRIEIRDGDTAERLRNTLGLEPDTALPVILVSTRIDHGIFPVGSMTRDGGSLAPGLGDAASTITLEMPDGEILALPGSVNSRIGLTGNLVSTYDVPAGNLADLGGDLTWSEGRVRLETTPDNTRTRLEAELDSLSLVDTGQSVSLEGLSFEGEQRATRYGYSLGNVNLGVAAFSVPEVGQSGSIDLIANGRIEQESVILDLDLDLASSLPGAGETVTTIEMTASGIDPGAFGTLVSRYRAVSQNPALGPDAAMAEIQPALQALLAEGLDVDVSRLNVTLQGDTIESEIDVDIQSSDVDTFTWSTLLLATEANASLRIPEGLLDYLAAMNPNVSTAVGLGYLKKDGVDYVADVRYAKGILNINGAPTAIPLTAP
jgi:uncharacterized protein YdgA (DUF945 family)